MEENLYSMEDVLDKLKNVIMKELNKDTPNHEFIDSLAKTYGTLAVSQTYLNT